MSGQLVGDWFDNQSHKGSGATTIRGNGVTGIYYRGSGVDLSQNIYLNLHEFAHLAYPRTIPAGNTKSLDELLGNALGLRQRTGADDTNQETWTNAVSRYFDQKCDPQQRN